MEKLIINKTFSTPEIIFDAETGRLEMEGRVIPEDPESFFEPIFDWIENFRPSENSIIQMRVKLYYYNTSSVKRILNIFKKLDSLYQRGSNIKISWEYEEGDDDAVQDGEDFKSILKLPFEIKRVDS